ncbi:protein ALTERED XYLOGLUCAN 9 [Diospyros lotus]|uniref:protein ALTERED XYLOGLUCAN 9 n=1 Tax=Diospyros lotus TaxID=55363 RepID=UPI0022518CDC|nr:protein ALTERED XYLOGLUCAN 9 [Diospyros lotus]
MLGALQLGVLAACVVLFVPMGMAGWHLSRNKMLFFSGALFITLAVGVHLTPYFSSISNLVSSFSSVVVLENRESCISLLHKIVFDVETLSNASDSEGSWTWAAASPVAACEFQKLGLADASDLLNGSWVVVAGDSQARLVVVSLLGLVLGKEEMGSVRGDLFKRHSDYQIVVDEIGMKLDFVWAPYVSNLTSLMMDFKVNNNYPDVLVMGAGLWHVLHVTNSLDYGISLRLLRQSVVSLLPVSPELGTGGPVTRSPHLFWLGMPELINSMLNTEEKREKMKDDVLNAYDRELHGSKLLRQSGGPLLLLDTRSLSQKCGEQCTMDGMHYGGVVYEAAVHVMLNALLIESHQRL